MVQCKLVYARLRLQLLLVLCITIEFFDVFVRLYCTVLLVNQVWILYYCSVKVYADLIFAESV